MSRTVCYHYHQACAPLLLKKKLTPFKYSCHPLRFHEQIRCKQPCERTYDNCGHRCHGLCSEACGPCGVPVLVTGPRCGHPIQSFCDLQKRGVIPLCETLIETRRLNCGHSRGIQCYQRDNEEELQCKEFCMATLECGHTCRNRCSDCSVLGHGDCQDKCDKILPECGHDCGARLVLLNNPILSVRTLANSPEDATPVCLVLLVENHVRKIAANTVSVGRTVVSHASYVFVALSRGVRIGVP